MIILGNKYNITKQEKQLLLSKVESIQNICIKDKKDEEIINQLELSIKENKVEFLVLNLDGDISTPLKSYLEQLDYDGLKIVVYAQFAKEFLKKDFIEFSEENINIYQSIHNDESQKVGKRIFDFFFSVFALLLLSPFILIIAIMIKIKSPEGKVFFTQQRLGLNGKFFRVFKFRTMVANAEEKLRAMLESDEEIRQEYLKYRKLKEDPRIIPIIGQILRKTSLDELPQFFNVLLGSMSVVGPRPYIENEFYNHDSKFLDVILSVKPGVTGLWQVSNRNNDTFNDRVLQDIKYINEQSMISDIKIVFKTILVVVKRKGI